MKLPTPGDMKGKAMSLLMALMLLNFVMAGGWRLGKKLLRFEWQFFGAFAPILVPIGIGIALGTLLKLGFVLWRDSAWRWRR